MVSVFVHGTLCLVFFMSAALLLRAVLFCDKNCKFKTAQCKNSNLIPQTLRHNFLLMGAAFDGELNHNFHENDVAMSGRSDLNSHNTNLCIVNLQA